MEKGLRAFFYEYKYYLFPESCADTEDLKKLGKAEFRRLREENCMAPDFVEESIVTESLEIGNPEKVFPVTVNIYTQAEYDSLLKKQVEKRCVGCLRFGGDADDLTGHHREISLSGVCYSREEAEENSPFARLAAWFWEIVAEQVNRLAELADAGNQREINKILNRQLSRFFLPLDFYCGVENGRYCLCMSSEDYSRQGVRAVVKMLAETAMAENSSLRDAGWKVYACFPKDVYRPKIRPDYFKRPPRLFAGETLGGGIEIAVYEEGADKWTEKQIAGRRTAAYRYLCSRVGEDLLLAGSDSIAFSDTVPEDKDEVTAEELYERLKKCVRDEYGELVPFPAPLLLHAGGEEEDRGTPLPYKEKVHTWVTVCGEMSPENHSEDPFPINTLFESFGIVYAYIFLPGVTQDGTNAERAEIWRDYLDGAWDYPQPITLPDDKEVFARRVGFCFSDEGTSFDYMVFDEKEFFRVLRNLSPVLVAYGAKIVTVKRDGVIVYDPGYVVRPEDAGYLA